MTELVYLAKEDDLDDDNTYIAEFYNFNGECVGSFEINCTTTFIVYPITSSINRYFKMRERKDPTRLSGLSHDFYECDEPILGEDDDNDLVYSDVDLTDFEEDTSPQGWRLWLDHYQDDPYYPDHHTPDGWLGAKSSHEAMALVLEYGMPTIMDLDFDLGPNDTAEKFLKELVKIMVFPPPQPPAVRIHTSNSIGRNWIIDYIDTWQRAADSSS